MFEQFFLEYNTELKSLYSDYKKEGKQSNIKRGLELTDFMLIGIIVLSVIALFLIKRISSSALGKLIYLAGLIAIIFTILKILLERFRQRWIKSGGIKRQYDRHQEALRRVHRNSFRNKEYKAFLQWVKDSSEEKLEEINRMSHKVEKVLSLSTLTAVIMSVVGFIGGRIVNIIEQKKTLDSDPILIDQIINDMGIIYAIAFIVLVCLVMLGILSIRKTIKDLIEIREKKTTHMRLLEHVTFQLIEDAKG